MPENKKNSPSTEPVRSNAAAAVCAFAVLAAFAAVLIIPQSREVFKSLSSAHPYIMGFIKFGLLATVGEVLALRLRKKAWILHFNSSIFIIPICKKVKKMTCAFLVGTCD